MNPNCNCCESDPTLGDFIPGLEKCLERLDQKYRDSGDPVLWPVFSPEFNAVFDVSSAPTAAYTKALDIMTITDAGAPFIAGLVGKQILIRSSTSYKNNGQFKIISVGGGGTTATYENADGVAEAAGTSIYKVAYSEKADDDGREANSGRTVYLYQTDFDKGTLRLDKPGRYVLMENIVFEPNEGDTSGGSLNPASVLDWDPDAFEVASNSQYFIGDYSNGYNLGFFGAFAVEAERVIIDGNGYGIKWADGMNTQQRFGSEIELADQPFRTQQGPGEFGGVLRSGRKVWIKNIHLGTAHHGVHGNGNSDILYTDVTFDNIEIAAISQNSSTRVLADTCQDKGRKSDIPVYGTYSALRFSVKFAKLCDAAFGAGTVDAVTFQGVPGMALTKALAAVNRIFNDIIFDNKGVIDTSMATGIPAHAPFANWKKDAGDVAIPGTGLIDGPCYSMVFHPELPAIFDFLEEVGTVGLETSCIVLRKCAATEVNSDILEVPAAINQANGVRLLDPTAAVLQLLNVYKDDDGNDHFMRNPVTGEYVGTILSNLQLALARVQIANPAQAGDRSLFGLNALIPIDPKIVDWATDNNNDKLELTEDANGRKQLEFTSGASIGTKYPLAYGGDGMHHVAKGNTPFRFDGVSQFLVEDCIISESVVQGPVSPGLYIDGSDGGNQAQTHRGYWGTRIQAIRLSTCKDGEVRNTTIHGISSYWGQVYGVEVEGDSDRIKVGATIEVLTAGTQATATTAKELSEQYNGSPNNPPIARAVKVGSNASNVCTCDVKAKNIKSYPGLRVKDVAIQVDRDC